jgi:hypothetical protein
MERKIEIYNFSARTRQLFIRLLALVKWASSAAKVDTSAVSLIFNNVDRSGLNGLITTYYNLLLLAKNFRI